MNEFQVVENLTAVMNREVLLPTVVMWNRLEGRPRNADFTGALRAEVRDALWMLARQWQVGEFKGDDAGSPVTAKLSWVSDPVTHVRSGSGAVTPFDDDTLDTVDTPLEALTERQAVPSALGGRVVCLDLRLLMGRQWAKRLRAAGLSTVEQVFRDGYRIAPPDTADPADHAVTAHPAAWQAFDAVAGRAIDGLALYEYLAADATHLASDGLGLAGTDKDTVDGLGPLFVRWFRRLYLQPAGPAEDSWRPAHLEYSVALSAPAGAEPRSLVADEYHGGHLDWYSFDRDDSASAVSTAEPFPPPGPPDPARRVVRSFLPTGVQFDGMPNTRWWTFEEGVTNFGEIQPDTTDLSKLLLVEFGLVYANDWFLAPVQLPVGTVTRVDGLAVTNVFGERIWIEPSSTAVGDEWRTWAMFTLAGRDGPAEPGLVLLTTTPEIQQGGPVEAVQFVRDEVANMVWAIETTIALPDGSARRGREAATELRRRYQDAVGAPPAPEAANGATVAYRLANSVGENWIPFIPVHLPGDNREIQLRRGSMPRLLAGATGAAEPVRPRTGILRPGADAAVPPPYHVFEEEVGRAGEIVSRSWQRTRRRDGRVVTWLGLQRRTGRGEASSGLAFDRLAPVDNRP